MYTTEILKHKQTHDSADFIIFSEIRLTDSLVIFVTVITHPEIFVLIRARICLHLSCDTSKEQVLLKVLRTISPSIILNQATFF